MNAGLISVHPGALSLVEVERIDFNALTARTR